MPSKQPSFLANATLNIPFELQELAMRPVPALQQASADALIQAVSENHDIPDAFLETTKDRHNIRLEGHLFVHGVRTAATALLMNEVMKEEKADPLILATGALLHDVGKTDPRICAILEGDCLAGPKMDTVPRELKRHPGVGRSAFNYAYGIRRAARTHMTRKQIAQVAEAILCHHERMDGTGYLGKRDEEIPQESRLIFVADALDVMQTPRGKGRLYKEEGVLGIEAAIAECRRSAGLPWNDSLTGQRQTSEHQFDPRIVEIATDIFAPSCRSAGESETEDLAPPIPLFAGNRRM